MAPVVPSAEDQNSRQPNAETAAEPPATAGSQDAHEPNAAIAPQPPAVVAGQLVLWAPQQHPWRESHFVASGLRDREDALAATLPRACSLRGALQEAVLASTHLPLRADLFYNGDIRAALGCRDAVVVTAERINSVADPNRGGALRVDFLAYNSDGSVTRYHPGGTRSQDAKPHTMQQTSRVFLLERALEDGVGAALHVRAPGSARGVAVATEHGGSPSLCTAMDLQEIHPLDAKLISTRMLEAALATALGTPGTDDVDWSTEGFPWWVVMAGHSHQFAALLQECVVSVKVTRARNGNPELVIQTEQRSYNVRVAGGRLRVG